MVVTESIKLFDRLMDVVQSSVYEPLNRVIKGLYKDASTAIGGIQMDPASEVHVLDCLSDTQEGLDLRGYDTECFGLEEWGNQLVGDSIGFDEILDPVEWTI